MSWKSWKYEDWLLKNRSVLAGGITVLAVAQIGLFVRVLVIGPWLGISSIEVIEGLLATGTFALAFAALVQAISAEKKRQADLAPHLEVNLLWPETALSPRVNRSKPITYDIFPVEIPADGCLTGSVSNLGPGHAMKLKVVAYPWWATAPQTATDGFGVPVESTVVGWEEPVRDMALKANTDHQFPLMVLLAASADFKDAKAQPMVRQQTLVVATCEDVEGKAAGVARRGMFVIGPLPPYPSRMLSWKMMDDEMTLRIHMLQKEV
jgi:hypothetical protein